MSAGQIGTPREPTWPEVRVAAPEKAKVDKQAQGEFESERPGYCGAQDTFYLGTIKGVGRIYQQTLSTRTAFLKSLFREPRPISN